MSFLKEWATNFWHIAKDPAIMLGALIAGYWGTAGLYTAVSYLFDAGVSFWAVMAMFMLCLTVLASLVMTVVLRRQK